MAGYSGSPPKPRGIVLLTLCLYALICQTALGSDRSNEGCVSVSEAQSQDPSSSSYMSLVPIEFVFQRVPHGDTLVHVLYWEDLQRSWTMITFDGEEVHTSPTDTEGLRKAFNWVKPWEGNEVVVKLINGDLAFTLHLKNLGQSTRQCIKLLKINVDPQGHQVYAQGEDLRFKVTMESQNRNIERMEVFPELFDLQTQQPFQPTFQHLSKDYRYTRQDNPFINSTIVKYSATEPEIDMFVNTSSYQVTGFLVLSTKLRLPDNFVGQTDVERFIVIRPAEQQGPYPDNFVYFKWSEGDVASEGQRQTKFCRSPSGTCEVGCDAVGVAPLATMDGWLYRLDGGDKQSISHTSVHNGVYPFYYTVESEINPNEDVARGELQEIDFQCQFNNGPGEVISRDIRLAIFKESSLVKQDSHLVWVNDTTIQTTCVAIFGAGQNNLTFELRKIIMNSDNNFVRDETIVVEPDTVTTDGDRVVASLTRTKQVAAEGGNTVHVIEVVCRLKEILPGYGNVLEDDPVSYYIGF